MSRRRINWPAVAVAAGVAAFWLALVVALLPQPARAAEVCPVLRLPAPDDRCTLTLDAPGRATVERLPALVIRLKQLESSDLQSWQVPGAVVIVLDGMRRGQQMAVPLSILSECRP